MQYYYYSTSSSTTFFLCIVCILEYAYYSIRVVLRGVAAYHRWLRLTRSFPIGYRGKSIFQDLGVYE